MDGDPQKIVFAQGMRRSGTTIVFDLMLESGLFECFYEPLAKAAAAPGGGSQAHGDIDLFSTLRVARQEFVAAHPELLARCPEFVSNNFLNYGAPRLAELEFEPDLPGYVEQYIRFLSRKAPQTFLKFTRMHSKVHCLAEIAPDAKFLHLVRDPRHVVASYLFGKNGKNRDRFQSADIFFGRVSQATAWSSRPFSDFIISLKGFGDGEEIQDFLRILLIWKYKFETTHRLGKAAFGDNYMLFRHEDLLRDPQKGVRDLFAFIGAPVPEQVTSWSKANIRAPSRPYEAGDERWMHAFNRLDMWDALDQAGYDHLLPGAASGE